MENGLNSSQLVFQEDNNLQFNCSGGASSQGTQRRVGVGVNVGLGVSVSDSGRKTREMSSFVGEKMFSIEGEQRFFGNQSSEFRRNMYESSAQLRQDRRDNPNWNHNGSSDGSDGDDDDDDDVEDDDEVEEGDGEVDGLVNLGGGNKKDNSSGSVHSSSDKLRVKGNLQKDHSSLGSNRGFLGKDGNGIHSGNNIRGGSTDHQQGRVNHYNNAVTVAAPDMYYSQFLQGPEGSSPGQKEIGENGCGFSGGKEGSLSLDCGEPLRAILSDPITGTLMDDAMILPCGHSFGSAGLQHVIRMKACYTCSQSVTEDLVAPNLCKSVHHSLFL
ncbi:U-box domain-containing protein 62-like [Thalictrum thalictroides]|uniref:U-box domain-containing protein 62-like n=1 Tax=Thalictrum thalictroides TaxID=46969 RepID=A0A7J6WIF6_THATH|nr:U-box domain-containing protein 62-like [Thalictrum thalictroides]